MTDRQFTLASGRKMGMTAVGEALSVRVVVMCHPMPGAGDFDPNPIVSRNHGVRLLAFDRPGYGGSEPLREGESTQVQSRADDIAEFLTSQQMESQTIGAPNFGVVGWGFGGAVALSLAARHPKLIRRAAIVGFSRRVVWHAQDEPIPSILGLPPEPGPATFPRSALGIDHDDPGLAFPGVGDRLDHMLAEAALQGTVGIETDQTAAKDLSWSDELGSVSAETAFLYGSAGRLTNSVSGQWLRSRTPHSRLIRVPDARGLAIVSVWRQILEHVSPESRD